MRNHSEMRTPCRWLMPVATIWWGFAGLAGAAPIPVALAQTSDGWQLIRGGEPYLIRGAGGEDRLAELAEAGGNSIRTWGTDGLGPILDRAQARGLTVSVGFWLGHERHGFDYTDAEAVHAQAEQAREALLRYRDHPAILLWSVGNEMEGDGGNPAIWFAVNQIARLCHELDPHHPTMTVVAEVGGTKIANLHRFCPDVDIVGINTYGGAQTIAERYRDAGGTKPFVMTEFGPPGHWEMGKTSWGAPHELTSTEKGEWYTDAHRAAVVDHADLCLGAYAFLWGAKQEATATWFGMFLDDGTRLAPVEAMTRAWGGAQPANRCPRIGSVELDRSNGLNPGDTLQAALAFSDPDGDPLEVKWILRPESGNYATGGDQQAGLPAVAETRGSATDGSATLSLPDYGGPFRLFAYVYDGHGNAAVANEPIQIDGPPPAASAGPAVTLPFVLYGEGQIGEPYAPSGYMGNTGAIRMDPASGSSPQAGDRCLRVDYRAANGWGGVIWQSPPNNWGDQPGGYNLTGAETLEFWARGEKGGELISVSLGLLGPENAYPDSGKAERKDLRLSRDWQRFQVPVTGLDLSSIKTGFAWTVAGQGAPITFYLDEVRYLGPRPQDDNL